MLAGGHTSGAEEDSSYNGGGHQLNQRDVSFGHDEESANGRDSIEVCSANNIQRQSLGRPGPRMSEQNSVFSQKYSRRVSNASYNN
jgi:hypothetical protein